MLRRLLAKIAAGQAGNINELATAIDASPEMVEVMIEELERRGLLQRAGECGKVCNGCPAELACDPRTQGSAWMLTTAGRRYAAR